MRIKAAILNKINEDLIIDEIETPLLACGKVLVKIHKSSICGAQIGEICGKRGEDRFLPHLLGHEGGGEVVDIGVGVTNVKIGDHVVLHWRKGQGIEGPFPQYKWGSKYVGGGHITTFSEYSVVSENRVTKIGKDIPYDVASLMGCAVTTGFGLINNEAKLKIGESILVAGCGGVGLNVIQGAALAGASEIVGVDILDEKLAVAVSFGATHVTNNIREIKHIDVFVDCTGSPDVINYGFSCAQRTILVAQIPRGVDLVIPDMGKNYSGKILMDSQGGGTNPSEDIPRYIKLYKDGKINIDNLITHRFSLDDINSAINLMKTGLSGRCILEM